MRYIDRRFLFPVVAATAWAQQPSPEAAAAEAAVRARAQAFFDTQVAKNYRQGEAMVADESKDLYYNGKRLNLESFTITKVEMTDANTKANVTIKGKSKIMVPALGKTFELESLRTTHWKMQNGEWVYLIDDDLNSPFGKLDPQAGAGKTAGGPAGGPDLASMMHAVRAEKDSVDLKPGETQKVKISNSLPGPVDISMENFSAPGVSAKLEKRHLEQGETTSLEIVATDKASGTATIILDVSPLGTHLPISINVR